MFVPTFNIIIDVTNHVVALYTSPVSPNISAYRELIISGEMKKLGPIVPPYVTSDYPLFLTFPYMETFEVLAADLDDPEGDWE